jgi:sulfofructose kinase
VVVGDDGDRTIFNRTDPALWASATPPSEEELLGSDAVLVDVRWPAGALAAVRAAGRLGIPSVVDCDLTDDPVSETLLRAATHVVFSQPAFERFRPFSSASAVQAMATDLGGVVAATKGGDGVVWSDGGPAHHTPAFRIDALDTLGAGDVFHGAYALGVAEGRPLADIVEWASAVAAVKCARAGGRIAFPTRDEVDQFLGRTGP